MIKQTAIPLSCAILLLVHTAELLTVGEPLAPQQSLNEPSSEHVLPLLAANITSESAPGDELQVLDAPIGVPESSGQKCVAVLNLASYFNRSAHGDSKRGPSSSSFSFALGDIYMPVAPKEGSLDSAMRLLSTFSQQLTGDEPEEAIQEQAVIENTVQFSENRLELSGLNLSMLDIHLYSDNTTEPRFGGGISIKNTTLTGRFVYHAPLIVSGSKLAGYYRMSIDGIYMVVSSNLTKHRNSAESEPNGQYSLRTDAFKANISNLGYISIDILDSKDAHRTTSNYLLRMLQRLLQKTIKKTYYTFEGYIRDTLEREGRRFLDCELTRFTPLLENSASSSHQNDLARILSAEIAHSQLSSVPLPDFEHQQSLFGSSATVSFSNGSIGGLHNIKFSGDTRVKLQDEHLFVNTSVGWSQLRPHYNWTLAVGSSKTPMSKGFVAFTIKNVDFDAVITKGLNENASIVVEQLDIRHLDSPKMDIGGLPGMNRITRGMVNFFMARLKQRLSSSIQPVLQLQLERSLNRMSAASV